MLPELSPENLLPGFTHLQIVPAFASIASGNATLTSQRFFASPTLQSLRRLPPGQQGKFG